MAAQVRVERRDGRLVAVKEADPASAERLAREAEVLARAQVPGVVQLVAPPSPTHPVMLTGWVGGRTLADLPRPLPASRAAALVVALAATLERLHRVGLVHGAVSAEHVLLDARGRPVLCGFADAGPAGSTRAGPASSGDAPAPRRPADDVAGLGRLLADLLRELEPDGHGARSDVVAGSGGRRGERRRRRALLDLAARARADDPALRPSSGAVAQAARHAAPDALLEPFAPSEGEPETEVDASVRPVRTAPPARPVRDDAVLLSDLVDVDAHEPPARRARHARRRPGRGRLAAVLPPTFVALTVAITAYLGLTAWRSTDTPPPTPTAPMPLSTAGTVEPRDASSSAPVVVHDRRRFQVGGPGDQALVGPWLCDGRDLVAVLRPADGSVHLFEAWAPAGGRAQSRLVRTVDGADEITEVRLGPQCSALELRRGPDTLTTLTSEDLR